MGIRGGGGWASDGFTVEDGYQMGLRMGIRWGGGWASDGEEGGHQMGLRLDIRWGGGWASDGVEGGHQMGRRVDIRAVLDIGWLQVTHLHGGLDGKGPPEVLNENIPRHPPHPPPPTTTTTQQLRLVYNMICMRASFNQSSVLIRGGEVYGEEGRH